VWILASHFFQVLQTCRMLCSIKNAALSPTLVSVNFPSYNVLPVRLLLKVARCIPEQWSRVMCVHWRMCAHVYYLTDVLEVFNVVSLRAHDLIDDVSPHLVSVLEGWAQTQAVIGWIQVPILHLAGPLGRLPSTVLLIHPQLRTNIFQTHRHTKLMIRTVHPYGNF